MMSPTIRNSKVVAQRSRILYLQFEDAAAYPPLEHSSRILAERGWEVAFLGAEVVSDGALRLPDHPRITVTNIRAGALWGLQPLRYIYFVARSLYWIIAWRPAWVYASDPTVLPALWAVHKLTSANIIYHEHDSPNPGQNTSRFMRLVLQCRKTIGREAAACILPQQQRLEEFIRVSKRTKTSFCVWNCPTRDEIRKNTATDDRGLAVYYHGSINAERLPPELAIAVSRFKGTVRLFIAGYEVQGSSGHVDTLKRIVESNGAAGAIHYIGAIPLREDLLKFASKAHVGLSLMPTASNDINVHHMVGASNKPFDFMACGLPLLVSRLPDWVNSFVTPGFGRACDPSDADSIERELRWYIEHPSERAEMGRRNADEIRRVWNYESMFESALRKIETGVELSNTAARRVPA